MSTLLVTADTLTQEQLEKYVDLLREWKSAEKSNIHFRHDQVKAAFQAQWIANVPSGAKAITALSNEIHKIFKEVTALDPKVSAP